MPDYLTIKETAALISGWASELPTTSSGSAAFPVLIIRLGAPAISLLEGLDRRVAAPGPAGALPGVEIGALVVAEPVAGGVAIGLTLEHSVEAPRQLVGQRGDDLGVVPALGLLVPPLEAQHFSPDEEIEEAVAVDVDGHKVTRDRKAVSGACDEAAQSIVLALRLRMSTP